MKHPASQHLFAYWNDVRAGRAAPERRDIDPAAVRGMLADMLMIDVVPDSPSESIGYPVRLSGTRVNALFGFDITARSLPSLWRLRDQAEITSLVTAVLDETRPAVVGLQASPAGEDALAMELLLLPLRHHGKTHARLLGTLSPIAVPDWFGMRPVMPLVLGPHRMITPCEPRDASPTVLHPAFAKARNTGRRHGQFVIYEGGRL